MRSLHAKAAHAKEGWPALVRGDVLALCAVLDGIKNMPLAMAPDPFLDPIFWDSLCFRKWGHRLEAGHPHR